MRIFVKYMLGSFNNASRNKRELSVVRRFDCEIIVCDHGEEEGIKQIDGFTVYRRKNELFKNRILRKLQIIYRLLIGEPHYLRQMHAYCISCHDLTALFIGWLSTLFMSEREKPKLVYDSHEFEIGRNTNCKRSKFSVFMVTRLEKFLMDKCVFSIMVNDTIADEVQRIHGLEKRPLVIRNIPAYWNIEENVCRQRRLEYCRELGVPEDTFIVMYHGGVMLGRGIEKLLEAVKRDNNTAAIILGDGEEDYVSRVKHQAAELNVSERVLFLSAVPVDILWQYVGAADVGVSLAANTCLNHYYMLPNKIFENIQALTPIIGSDFPEIRRIVKGYDIGLCVDPENTDDIVSAMEKMRTDKERYGSFKRNLKKAKDELCWENESKVLAEAYGKILR